MGLFSTLFYVLRWYTTMLATWARVHYRRAANQWPACTECGKPCNGDPRGHDGPCTRDGLVFCSTWCSMMHGRKARPWKTVKSELRDSSGILVATVEGRLPDSYDPNPWRWALWQWGLPTCETGTTADDLDAEEEAQTRARQLSEFRNGQRSTGLWTTVKSALFSPEGRQLAHVIRDPGGTSPLWPPSEHKPKRVTWRWTISQPYETGHAASLHDAQDAASDRLTERSKSHAGAVVS